MEDFFALFLLMLVTGIFWGPWFALSRSMKVFNADEFINITKVLSANLSAPMRFMLPGSIVLLIAATVSKPFNTTAFHLDAIAALLVMVALVITVVIEMPIVKQIEQWTNQTLPTNWQQMRDRWLKFHVVRVVSTLVAFGCFAAGMVY